jgi:hypothetical protein
LEDDENDLTLLGQQKAFPLHVLRRLEDAPLDYAPKHASLVQSPADGTSRPGLWFCCATGIPNMYSN